MTENTPSVIVEVQALSKVFRDFWSRPKVRAVDGLDLNIRRGEIFGLLGPNGSGKSTTIKMLLGLLAPSAGRILVFGSPPRTVATKSRIGYLPEESYLYNYLTPRETLHFFGRLFDLPAATRQERVEQLIDMTGLRHAAHRPVGEFSKGMARRVGLAQALINDPELVILDEPTSGLDPIGCRQVKDLMLALARRGKTILLSSHLLADVEDVCDRIAILYNGKVRAEGRVNDLLEKRDRIRLTLQSLSPEALDRILALIREKTGKTPDVDRPAMNLEQFFLEVVEAAHKDAAAPSGTTPAETVADYLAPGTKH